MGADGSGRVARGLDGFLIDLRIFIWNRSDSKRNK